MSLTTTRPHSTAGDLLRLAALWLAAILIVQGVAAAVALGAGPLHHHRQRQHLPTDTHAHAHAAGERHHHAAGDAAVVAEADPAASWSDAAGALLAALALLASDNPRPTAHAGAAPVRRAIGAQPARGIAPEPPLHPPQPA
jgi:hypothetical protein